LTTHLTASTRPGLAGAGRPAFRVVAWVRGAFRTAASLALAGALTVGCAGGVGSLQVEGDPAALEGRYTADLRERPDDPEALARLGVVELKLGRPGKARDLLDKAAQRAPEDPEIARWQGEAALAHGDGLSAHQAFRRALEHDDDWTETFR